MVVEFSFPFHRNLKADYVRNSGSKFFLNLILRQMAAVPVVAGSHLVFRLNFTDSLQPLGIAETVVGLALFQKLLSIFFVEFKTLALNIRTKISALIAAFVPVNSKPVKGIVKVFYVFFVVTGTVSVFQTQDKFSAFRTGKKVVEQGSPYTADVLQPRRRRSIANTNFFNVFHNIPQYSLKLKGHL